MFLNTNITKNDLILSKSLGLTAKLGFAEGMKLKWVRFDKASGKVFRNVCITLLDTHVGLLLLSSLFII